ncbi:MAG: hypothetical protein AB1657_02000 [Candidatus Micrarchaeota archaeon]
MGEVDIDRESIAMFVGQHLRCDNPADLPKTKGDIDVVARWSPSGTERVALELAAEMRLRGEDCGERMQDIFRAVQRARSGRIGGPARCPSPCSGERKAERTGDRLLNRGRMPR